MDNGRQIGGWIALAVVNFLLILVLAIGIGTSTFPPDRFTEGDATELIRTVLRDSVENAEIRQIQDSIRATQAMIRATQDSLAARLDSLLSVVNGR